LFIIEKQTFTLMIDLDVLFS